MLANLFPAGDNLMEGHFFDGSLVDRALASRPDYDAYARPESPVAHLIREAARRPRLTYLAVSKRDLNLEIVPRARPAD